MKAVYLIIGASIVILLAAAVLTGLQNFRSAEYTEPHNVTTGVGENSTTVVLTQALFSDSTSYVTITSNDTGDAAIPASYVSATKTLTVSGLLASISRQLSITYRYPQLSDYWGADLASRTVPVLLLLGVIGIFVAAPIAAYMDRHS